MHRTVIIVVVVVSACHAGSHAFPQGSSATQGETVIVSSPLAGTFMGEKKTIEIPGMYFPTRNANITRFLGVPYAKPPTGNRRFARPRPLRVLNNVYNATSYKPFCPQSDDWSSGAMYFTKSEDCLYLDIYIPNSGQNNMSVLVWFHGGAFRHGGSYYYSGDITASVGGVIVVVAQYRLGAFGFLSDGSNGSGNYGLWDQRQALLWVKNNIEYFNGNPESITIGGQSAGGASVVLQSLYNGNVGHFQRIIAQSGTPLSEIPWAIQPSPESLFQAFAGALGCSNSNISAVYDCLKQKPTDAINTVSDLLPYPFTPSIDGQFIDQHPSWSLGDSSRPFQNVDLLVGNTNKDGWQYLRDVWLPDAEVQYGVNISAGVERSVLETSAIPLALSLAYLSIPSTASVLSVIREYANWNNQDDNPEVVRDKAIEMTTDLLFHLPSVIAADAHATSSNTSSSTYFYQFSHRPFYILGDPWLNGARHSDELGYVFGFVKNLEVAAGLPPSLPPTPVPDIDRALSELMMVMWAEFIKRG